MKLSFFYALIFAGIAAIGNGMFVFGQKKSSATESPFIFLIMCLVVAIICLAIASFWFPTPEFSKIFQQNKKWALVSGLGIAITYFGFYYLYQYFGATYYILYAILAFLTTSIIVGIVLLKESFNIYYMLSIACAMLTLFLFFLGKKHS